MAYTPYPCAWSGLKMGGGGEGSVRRIAIRPTMPIYADLISYSKDSNLTGES
jgi:hypothetical protein